MKEITRKHITAGDFETIKSLQNVNFSKNLTGKVVGRSYRTVKRVYEAESFEQYKATKVKMVAKPAKAERPQEDTQLIINKLDQISACINTLIDIIQDKESKANASFWKR